MAVVFKQLDGKISCGVFVSYLLVFLYELLHTVNSLFYVFAMIYVYVSEGGILSLIHIYYGLEQFVYTPSSPEYSRYHRYSKEVAQNLTVEFVAPFLKFIKHVERADRAVGREGVCAGKVDEVEVIAFVFCPSFFSVYGNS